MKEAKDNHLEDSEHFKDLQKMQKRDFSRPATRKGSFMSKSVLGMEKSHEQESNANDQKGTDGNLSCAGISTLLVDLMLQQRETMNCQI